MKLLLPLVALFLSACGAAPPVDPAIDEPVLEERHLAGSAGAIAPAGCRSGDVVHPTGAKFTADDGCNTCTCTLEGAMCTKMACAPKRRRIVRFLPGSAVPVPEAMMVLSGMVEVLRTHPKDQVIVLGHATTGERRADGDLALRRAESVAARLRSLGASTNQLVAREGPASHDQPEVLFLRARR